MGISYVAVAVSLDTLASLYSARDQALLARIVGSSDRVVRHYLDAACRRDRCAPEDVLADIFRGAALTRFRPHVYAYALVACAHAVGVGLGGFDCAYSRPGKLTARLRALGEREEAVPLLLDPWPLPGVTPDDWPLCTTLRGAAVTRLALASRATLDRASPSLTDDDDEPSVALLTYFTERYEEASRRGADLLLVAH